MSKIIYNSIIIDLLRNDINSSYDTLIIEADYNFELAVQLLQDALTRIINNKNLEGQELNFYKFQLARIREFIL
ncbi:hypothetical protein [Clostridium sp.]|uniref:hypothetical protein n=1 Tax=Clostridium sp. TaxID=1506 RepID=UPI00261A284D|nr:hypothetical protein [Clostridium sp.]